MILVRGEFWELASAPGPGSSIMSRKDNRVPISSPSLDEVREFWQAAPCGTRDVADEGGELARYAALDRIRDEREPFIAGFARFSDRAGRRVLEVGVGAGSDHLRFARAGAECFGVDLTPAAVELTSRRLDVENLHSKLQVANAEQLPFPDASFDFVYSWGVIHHTPSPETAASEILRVLKPGAPFCVMVYNRHSLLAAQAWLRFGALRGRPLRSPSRLIAEHVESPGTKAYSAREATALFSAAGRVSVTTVLTPYDLRVGRRLFLPTWVRSFVPSALGWFHVIEGTR
jgi:SAM-dependent methyltransferase